MALEERAFSPLQEVSDNEELLQIQEGIDLTSPVVILFSSSSCSVQRKDLAGITWEGLGVCFSILQPDFIFSIHPWDEWLLCSTAVPEPQDWGFFSPFFYKTKWKPSKYCSSSPWQVRSCLLQAMVSRDWEKYWVGTILYCGIFRTLQTEAFLCKVRYYWNCGNISQMGIFKGRTLNLQIAVAKMERKPLGSCWEALTFVRCFIVQSFIHLKVVCYEINVLRRTLSLRIPGVSLGGG